MRKNLLISLVPTIIFFFVGILFQKSDFLERAKKFIRPYYYSIRGKEEVLDKYDYPHIYATATYTENRNKVDIRIINKKDNVPLIIYIYSAVTRTLLGEFDITDTLKKVPLTSNNEYSTCFDSEGNPCKNFYQANLDLDFKGAVILSTRKNIDLFSKRSYPREFFIINNEENDYKECSIGVVYPDYTWSAYNSYGGRSLYTRNFVIPGRVSSNVVTNQRPTYLYEPHNVIPSSTMHNLLTEKGLCALPLTNSLMDNQNEWTNLDVIVLTAHDEYWTRSLRDKIDNYVKNGGKLAIFSGNTAWRVFEVNNDEHRRIQNWAVENPPETTVGLASRFGIIPLADNDGACKVGVCPICTRTCIKREFEYYQKNNQMTKIEYDNLLGMQVLDSEHEFFKGTGLKNGDYWGHDSKLLYHEVDEAPFNKQKGIIDPEKESIWMPGYGVGKEAKGYDFSKIRYQKPKKIKALAGAWLTNWDSTDVQFSATFVDLNIEKGRVVNAGSVGWYKSIMNGDKTTKQIFYNIINELIE